MYCAPVADLRFVLERLLDAGQLAQLPQFRDFSVETAEAVLAEADRLATGVLAPINRSGDLAGAAWTPAGVIAPAGFGAAYRQYVEGGWPQLGIDTEHGGQGAPQLLVSAVEEIWYGANVALMLCPMLSRGASKICTTWPEKPHCGKSGVPFINSTTSFDFTSFSIQELMADIWEVP